MVYTIKNHRLTVTISEIGAELQSIVDEWGSERLWNGDPAFWGERAPVLFPFCGRVWNGKITAKGVPCKMDLHGFFRCRTCEVEQLSNTEIAFTQVEDDATLADYPFRFRVRIVYRLEENRLFVRAEITNTGNGVMPYGYGAHPGFKTPFDGGSFEDYYIQFSQKQEVRSLCFDENNCFLIGGSRPFPLEEGNRFGLRDADFETGSFFLCEMPGEATLKRNGSSHYLTFRYEGFPYLGFWKVPGANYICVEPWRSLPAHSGENTELFEKDDLVRAEAGETVIHEYSIEVG